MLVTMSKAAIKARVLVITIWIALTVLGLFGATNLDQLLTTSLSAPGSSSAAANEILNKSRPKICFLVWLAFLIISNPNTHLFASLK